MSRGKSKGNQLSSNELVPKKLPINSTYSKTSKALPLTHIEKQNVVFSFEKFKCISVKNKEFNNCFSNLWDYAEWSLKLIEKISEFSTMNVYDLKSAGSSTRCHTVKGRALDKLKNIFEVIGINFNEQLEYYELSLGTSEGRIFGYFIDNVYYVLLFDPHHLIYEQLQYGSKQNLLHKNYDPWNKKIISNYKKI